jgi:hypothetical protein
MGIVLLGAGILRGARGHCAHPLKLGGILPRAAWTLLIRAAGRTLSFGPRTLTAR